MLNELVTEEQKCEAELKNICIVKKKSLYDCTESQDVGEHVSLSLIKRRLQNQNLRGFSTRCKHMAEVKNRKTKRLFTKNSKRNKSSWLAIFKN